jgi:hypothetical protein
MSTSLRLSRPGFRCPLIESLEDRRLLSFALPAAILISPRPVAPAPTTTTPPTTTTTQPVLTGTTIHAITGQSFRAVIGTIRNLRSLPRGYTLHGEIDWGDGTASSDARFVRRSDGSIAVLGAHTYAAVAGYDITVVISAVPPPWSEAPVRLIGTLHSKADVIAANGGVTLNRTVGMNFAARLGFFRTTQPASTLRAVIDWGDGTRSVGKIVPLPTASIVPTYAVEGAHRYAATASYLVHISVYSAYPSPILSPTAPTAAPVILVAEIDSVINVLPPLRTTLLRTTL